MTDPDIVNSLLEDMLDQAIDEPESKQKSEESVAEPVAETPKDDTDVEPAVVASRWTLPRMSADPNKVVRYEEDENDPRNKKKSNTKKQRKLSPLEKLKQRYTAQWQKELRKEIYEELHSKAHEEGYQQGYQEGRDESLKETQNLQQQLRDFMQCFEAPIELINEEVEEQLELLAVTLAQQLVRREIKSNPGEIVGLIRESIKLLPASSRKIKINIHPDDAALVNEALSIEEDDDLKWVFIEDPMLTRGGCIIKSEQSVINVTLEHRLASLAGSVLSGNRSLDEPAEQPQQHKSNDELLSVETETETDDKLTGAHDA